MNTSDEAPKPEAVSEAYTLLFARSGEAVCILDLEGHLTSVNPACERLIGSTAAELVGRPVVDLVAPELREEGVHRFRERLRGDSTPTETELVTRDGGRIPVLVTSTLIAQDGDPVGVLGLITDLRPLRSALDGRVEAESSLREAETRFRTFFASAPIGEAIVSPDGHFLEVNAALCGITGYSETELRDLTFQDLTHPDDLVADLEFVRQMMSGEIRTYQMEKRYLHKNGKVVWILLSSSLVRSDAGEPEYFIKQIQDITERKRADDAIERSEARLTEAQHVARIGSWEWVVAADAIDWSAELYEMFDVDPETPITYTRYLERIHPNDLSLVEEAVKRAAGTSESYEVEHRVVLTTGEVRWIHGRGAATLGQDGPVVLRGTAQDITERKQAEEELRRLELRYRTLVEQLPLAMYIRPVDMSQPNYYVSPQVETMIGYPAHLWETNAGLLASIVHPDDRDRVLADAVAVRETGKPYRDEYRYITPDGRIVWVQDETFRLLNENGEPFVQGFLLEITDRKDAEAERDRLREALHDAQKLEAIGRLAGGVAHDFNNMLTAIKGYSELLLAGLQPGTRQHHEAEQIRRAAEQASSLPEQLLAFARKQPLESKVIDLNDLVTGAATLLAHLIGDRVKLNTILAPRPAFAKVDPERIEQTLVNLALNARDAMPRGGTLTIMVSTTEASGDSTPDRDRRGRREDGIAGAYAVIAVADDGDGMDAETREKAFEPFFTTKPQGAGSGLGLATVHGTVVQNGGAVQLESEPGQGTTVRLSFPSAMPDATAARGLESVPRPVVLLAEDEDLVRELVSSVLSGEAFDVHQARKGVEALELLDRLDDSPDLLITDLVMPRMGGRELAARVLARAPGIKTLFISGYSDDRPTAEEEADPNSVFVSKPFSPASLLRAVNILVERDPDPVPAVDAGTGGPVTCVIADDHPAVLDSVSRYLEGAGIAIVGRVARADEAVSEIVSLRPMTALVDITMEPFSGIEVARQAAIGSPQTGIVMYTGHHDHALLREALDVGARGFVLKKTPLSELVTALNTIAAGETYVDILLAGALTTAATTLVALTKREQEVLTLLASGMTNEKAASALGISAETIQSHVRNAMTKLDADTRTEAVATAIRQALIV
ncbi:MAG: PAS domain S-box protein [Thermoleophilia bacterium]|nr:PAS domain S-box protein [Thermoleophilia bacterium]